MEDVDETFSRAMDNYLSDLQFVSKAKVKYENAIRIAINTLDPDGPRRDIVDVRELLIRVMSDVNQEDTKRGE